MKNPVWVGLMFLKAASIVTCPIFGEFVLRFTRTNKKKGSSVKGAQGSEIGGLSSRLRQECPVH